MEKDLNKIEGILKVLDKATFNDMKVNDVIEVTNKVTEFAKGLKSLKDIVANPVKIGDEPKTKVENPKDK